MADTMPAPRSLTLSPITCRCFSSSACLTAGDLEMVRGRPRRPFHWRIIAPPWVTYKSSSSPVVDATGRLPNVNIQRLLRRRVSSMDCRLIWHVPFVSGKGRWLALRRKYSKRLNGSLKYIPYSARTLHNLGLGNELAKK